MTNDTSDLSVVPFWRKLSSLRTAALLGAKHALGGHQNLYHYTTPLGFRGIIEDRCLFATSAVYLNDSSEINYGLSMLKTAMDDWQARTADANSVCGKTISQVRGFLDAPLNRDVYVACFCERDNLLSQWRAYTQLSGYSLGFSTSEGSTLGFEPESRAVLNAYLARVCYDADQQRELLTNFLHRLRELLNSEELQKAATEQNLVPPTMEILLALLVFDMLLEEVMAFKNPAFAEESEWRIIARKPIAKSLVEKEKVKRYYRVGRGLMVPYIKLLPTNSRVPLRSITTGPSIDRTQAESSITMFLEDSDHERVPIRGSDIPVVFTS